MEPVKFRIGDIVEAQMSFVTIPLRGKQFKMLTILRAITLLDSKPRVVSCNKTLKLLLITCSQDAEIARIGQKVPAIPIVPKIKRKVGYLDKEVEETRRKVSKLSVDTNLD